MLLHHVHEPFTSFVGRRGRLATDSPQHQSRITASDFTKYSPAGPPYGPTGLMAAPHSVLRPHTILTDTPVKP